MEAILQDILTRLIKVEKNQETLSENQQTLQESIEELGESVQNLGRSGPDYSIELYPEEIE